MPFIFTAQEKGKFEVTRKSSMLLSAVVLVVGLCAVAKPQDVLTIFNRDVLISNLSDETVDQLHYASLYESPNENWYLTYHTGAMDAVEMPGRTTMSSDGGETWSAWEGLTLEKGVLFHIFPTRLADDSLIFFQTWLDDLSGVPGGPTTGTAHMYRSTDDAHTWTKYDAPVTGMPYAPKLVTLWGPGIQMPDGRLLWGIMSREVPSIAGVAETSDSGQSFQYLASVLDDPSVGQRREPGIVRLRSGELISILRTGTDAGNMVLTRSSDDGQSWGDLQKLAEPGVCPQVLQLDNGAVVITYGTRYYLHAMASWDDGHTWSQPISLYEGQGSGYSSVQALSANSFRVVFDESSWYTLQEGGNRIVRIELGFPSD